MQQTDSAPQTEKSPVITLPQSRESVEYLAKMLGVYSWTLHNERNYKAPEQQTYLVCLVSLLSELLTKGELKTWDVIRMLEEKFGAGFRLFVFEHACSIINRYCTDGESIFPEFEVDQVD